MYHPSKKRGINISSKTIFWECDIIYVTVSKSYPFYASTKEAAKKFFFKKIEGSGILYIINWLCNYHGINIVFEQSVNEFYGFNIYVWEIITSHKYLQIFIKYRYKQDWMLYL